MNVTVKTKVSKSGPDGWASISESDASSVRVVLELKFPQKGPGVHVVELTIDDFGEIELIENGGLAGKAQLHQRDATVSGE